MEVVFVLLFVILIVKTAGHEIISAQKKATMFIHGSLFDLQREYQPVEPVPVS